MLHFDIAPRFDWVFEGEDHPNLLECGATVLVQTSLIEINRFPLLFILLYFYDFVAAIVLLNLISLPELALNEMASQKPVFVPPAAPFVRASHLEIKYHFGWNLVLLQGDSGHDPLLAHRAVFVRLYPVFDAQAAECVAE